MGYASAAGGRANESLCTHRPEHLTSLAITWRSDWPSYPRARNTRLLVPVRLRVRVCRRRTRFKPDSRERWADEDADAGSEFRL